MQDRQDFDDFYQERAAIIEFDAGLTLKLAERQAHEETMEVWRGEV